VIGDISLTRGKPLIRPSSPDLLSSSCHSPLHHSIHRFCAFDRATVAHITIGDCRQPFKTSVRPLLKSHATPLQPSVATDAQQGIAAKSQNTVWRISCHTFVRGKIVASQFLGTAFGDPSNTGDQAATLFFCSVFSSVLP
jgi:hypothetical protein